MFFITFFDIYQNLLAKYYQENKNLPESEKQKLDVYRKKIL